MRVIGTAGHVDHGKSTLIAALTGVHPDRLKEEQERQMTIDLGFGWLTLPNGEEIGIVDVPGHRDFIENMLAGIGGIDAALLVIAADEGVMPQTKEHLAIIDLLQIPASIIVLTKTDLIPDKDWLDLMESDVRTAVRETVLQNAPILRVSARTGSGLNELTATLVSVLGNEPERPDVGRARLPIDRVFTMSGFGAVVTGTLSDGQFSIGDEIEILPSGLTGRIRGLQTHKRKAETAQVGSRTAVNISGIAAEQIQRGEVLAHPNRYQATRRVDARFRLLKDLSSPLKHSSEVKVFLGSSETIATLRLLGSEELAPGDEAWIQLELRDPIVAVRGDRYILRRPSPGETLGGGLIADAQPRGRHKRSDQAVLKSLESLSQGSPAEILFEAALATGMASPKQIVLRSHLEKVSADMALNVLLKNGKLVKIDEDLFCALPHWNELDHKVLQIVASYHKTFPLRRGIPREELKSKLKLSPRIFSAAISLMVRHKTLLENGPIVAAPSHEITFDSSQRAKVDALMRKIAQNPFSPPSFLECQAETDGEILNALIEQNQLVAVSADVVFRETDYDLMVTQILETLKTNGRITLAEVRDLFNTSRKYAQAVLEHLDATGMTMREGDFRKLRK